MSQSEVYKILKDCGGFASQTQIKTIAKEKFPTATLHSYVGDRLKKLRKKQIVKKIIDDKGVISWEIIDDNFN